MFSSRLGKVGPLPMLYRLNSSWSTVTGLFLLTATAVADSEHWSFQPVRRPRLPAVASAQADWPRNPIDHFILAQQQRRGFAPGAEADRAALIRRASLDLTGLPPRSDELAAFAADTRPDAYERLVRRLLDSPRYGERMAIPWLDLARYADTHGYHMDAHRDMWSWRDWVVRALNENMPFDRFTLEQLAGDLLPGATSKNKIATGFHRNHMINFEDGAIEDEYRTEYVADRVVTTSTVWLGLTMGCCRCHDHRYDPLSQEDFFRLFAFFNNIAERGVDGDRGNAEPILLAPAPRQAEQLEALNRQRLALAAAMRRIESRESAAFSRWSSEAANLDVAQPMPPAAVRLALDRPADPTANQAGLVFHGRPRWTRGRFDDALLLNGKTYLELPDALSDAGELTLSAWVFPTTQDVMTIFSKSRSGPHARGFELIVRAGTVELRAFNQPLGRELRVASSRQLALRRWQHLAVTMDVTGRAAGVQLYLDGRVARLEVLADELDQPVRTAASLTLAGPRQPFRGLLDEVQLFDRPLREAEVARLYGIDPVRQALAIQPEKRTPTQQGQLRRYYFMNLVPEYADLYELHQAAQRDLKELQASLSSVMVMRELPQPRPTFVLEGGRYDRPLAAVSAGTPRFLPPFSDNWPRNRLGLARWLTDPRHPLVPRVVVNRIWQHHFGRGLVATADDFGAQGAHPTHPELLDWLAAELVDSGWDIKRLHYLMVTSATYRQSSRRTAQVTLRDPDNEWLAHMPRPRLPAELIRDSALAISGLLVEQMHGPAVFPSQPPGLWRELSYDPDEFTAQVYVPSRGADLYRRSLYTFWKRSVPPPNMEAFDAPSREVCVATRGATNTPLQSLVLMNDPTFFEAAKIFAEKIVQHPGSVQDRITYAYRSISGRSPTAQQASILEQLWSDLRASFERDPAAADQLLQLGSSSPSTPSKEAEWAAWTTTASVLFQMDEFLTRP